jgi:hypothetical protein
VSILYGRTNGGKIAPKNVLERLLLNSIGDTDNDCWEYLAKDCNQSGHKRIRLDDKTRIFVHRLAWEAFHAEPIPPEMLVLHRCDNPKCFNPNHLFLGTQKDNMQDCINKGRKNYSRKIKKEDYQKIKDSNLSTKQLAQKFNVTSTRILQIKRSK